MGKIEKFLARLDPKLRRRVATTIACVIAGDLSGLDVRKLKGLARYRVRVGNMRIIFSLGDGGARIISIERRSDTTYS